MLRFLISIFSKKQACKLFGHKDSSDGKWLSSGFCKYCDEKIGPPRDESYIGR